MKEINLKKAQNAYRELARATRWIHPGLLCTANDLEKAQREKAHAEARKAYEEAIEELDKAIGEAQGKCTARTIEAWDVFEALEEIENKLNITKKAMDGVTVAVDLNAQNFPGKHKGTPYSTIFEARYKSGSWRITDIYRAETRAQSKGCTVNLTEEAKAAILANFQTLSI